MKYVVIKAFNDGLTGFRMSVVPSNLMTGELPG